MQEKQETILKVIEIMINSPIFKWSVGTIVTTLVGWALVSIRNTNNKIKNSVSKEDLEKSELKLRKYTDDKIIVHEKSVHTSIHEAICDIKSDNIRIETKVDKILILLAGRGG